MRAEAGEPGDAGALSWAQADFNQPVCQDMSLKTGAMARARVRIGPDAIQMSSDTWLNMLNLNDQLIEASVRYGRIHLQLSKLEEGETVELEMPRGSLWLLAAGAYDIDTGSGAEDQPTRIIVFEGKARFVGGQSDLPIAAGEEVQVTGSYPALVTTERTAPGSSPAAPVSIPAAARAAPAPAAPAPAEPNPAQADLPPAAPQTNGDAQGGEPAPPPTSPVQTTAESRAGTPPSNPAPQTADGRSASAKAASASADARHAPSDDFLLWVEEADNQPQPSRQSTRYVSPETTGYNSLDRYGRWDTLPDSEAAWFPTSVPDDWAPYRFGHWDSIAPWGWTWIDDQPWGFAPFHYGRWINVDGHWGWVPGAVVPHPVYAPALVAFIDAPADPGSGPDAGPDVAWFPLGPGDDYSPWYQAGPDYVESINVVHRDRSGFGPRERGERGGEAWRGQFANRRFATVVPREAFAAARPVDRAMMRVPADRLERAALMRGAPRVMPATMRSMAGSGELRGGARAATPAAAGLGRESGRSNPTPLHEPGQQRVSSGGAAGRGGLGVAGQPAHGVERPQQELGRSQVGRSPAQAEHGGQLGGSQVGRGPAQAERGGIQQAARPQVFQNSVQGYSWRGTAVGPAASLSKRGARVSRRDPAVRAAAGLSKRGARVSRRDAAIRQAAGLSEPGARVSRRDAAVWAAAGLSKPGARVSRRDAAIWAAAGFPDPGGLVSRRRDDEPRRSADCSPARPGALGRRGRRRRGTPQIASRRRSAESRAALQPFGAARDGGVDAAPVVG